MEKEKKKKNIDKKEVTKKVLKFIKLGIDIFTYFVTLIVGIGLILSSCNSKKANTEDLNVNARGLKQHNIVTPTGDLNSQSQNLADNGFAFMGGFTQSGDTALKYVWSYQGGTYAPWFSEQLGAFELSLNNNVESFRLFTMTIVDDHDETHIHSVYKVVQTSSGQGYIDFYYYDNGSYGSITIDDRDFSYDLYHSITIEFPLYNFNWVLSDPDYNVNFSFLYYQFDLSFWGQNHDQYGYFTPYQWLNGQQGLHNYGWTTKTHHTGQNEEGGDTSGGGSVTPSGSLYGVFNLIYLGFTAVASIMTITLFPGVTLGTLMVLPYVSILILFVIKLFKR